MKYMKQLIIGTLISLVSRTRILPTTPSFVPDRWAWVMNWCLCSVRI